MRLIASILLLLFFDGTCFIKQFHGTTSHFIKYKALLSCSRIDHPVLDESSFWGNPKNTRHDVIQYIQEKLFDESNCTHHIQVLDEHLPLVIIDQFLSKQLCEAVLDFAQNQAVMQPSLMGSLQQTSEERTSTTFWIESWRTQKLKSSSYLSSEACDRAIRIMARQTSKLVGVPQSHFENLQLVRYLPGQEFAMHTDHLYEFNKLACRGRLATCLLYLNDSCEANKSHQSIHGFVGGNTYFPEFDAYITPKQGRLVFFFNTIQRPGSDGYNPLMNLDVNLKARHAGMSVTKGEKWICNFWIHPVPYESSRSD